MKFISEITDFISQLISGAILAGRVLKKMWAYGCGFLCFLYAFFCGVSDLPLGCCVIFVQGSAYNWKLFCKFAQNFYISE